MSAQLSILSGLGGKQPAALLLDTEQGRFLIDTGGPLEPGLPRGWDWPEGRPVDAVILSHDHVDHMGAVNLVPPGTPIYATDPVAVGLPDGSVHCQLPLHGEVDLMGVRVRTGQAGHSLGGVWLHFDVGEGLFYSGDFSTESMLFRFDQPPEAGLALLDASYGLYDQSQDICRRRLQALLDQPTLLPVPASGRALEMALWLEESGFEWSMDEICQRQLERLRTLPEGCFLPGVHQKLRRLQASRKPEHSQVVLVGSPEGIGEGIERLMAQGRYQVIYTGYLPPKAQRDVAQGKARWLRWNVHPRSTDLQTMGRRLQAERVVPLFTSLSERHSWQLALGPRLFIPPSNDIQLS